MGKNRMDESYSWLIIDSLNDKFDCVVRKKKDSASIGNDFTNIN